MYTAIWRNIIFNIVTNELERMHLKRISKMLFRTIYIETDDNQLGLF